jgi:hypothetical protein
MTKQLKQEEEEDGARRPMHACYCQRERETISRTRDKRTLSLSQAGKGKSSRIDVWQYMHVPPARKPKTFKRRREQPSIIMNTCTLPACYPDSKLQPEANAAACLPTQYEINIMAGKWPQNGGGEGGGCCMWKPTSE